MNRFFITTPSTQAVGSKRASTAVGVGNSGTNSGFGPTMIKRRQIVKDRGGSSASGVGAVQNGKSNGNDNSSKGESSV